MDSFGCAVEASQCIPHRAAGCRLSQGESLRHDGFFTAPDGAPSSASEVAEGVLAHAANSYEQRKTEYFGHRLASIEAANRFGAPAQRRGWAG